MNERRAAPALVTWELANRLRRVLACSLTQDSTGAFLLRLELQGEEILRETHYSEHNARQRSERLRSILAGWAETG